MQTKREINTKILKIIWGALLMSQIVYFFVLTFISGQNTEPLPDVNNEIVTVLSCMAMVTFFAAVYLFKFLMRDAKKQAGDINRADHSKLVQHYFTPFIVRLALFESVAVIGFALALMNRRAEMFYPYLVVSIVAFLSNFPTNGKIRAAYK